MTDGQPVFAGESEFNDGKNRQEEQWIHQAAST